MSNLLWVLISPIVVLVILNMYNGRKAKSETDDQFLFRKLRSAHIVHFVGLAAITFGAGFLFVATLSQFSQYWYMSLAGLAFMALFGYFLFVNIRRGKHPVAVALQTNPSNLESAEFQTISVINSPLLGMAYLMAQRSMLSIWFFHGLEMERLKQILLNRAPQVFSRKKGSNASGDKPQTAEEKVK